MTCRLKHSTKVISIMMRKNLWILNYCLKICEIKARIKIVTRIINTVFYSRIHNELRDDLYFFNTCLGHKKIKTPKINIFTSFSRRIFITPPNLNLQTKVEGRNQNSNSQPFETCIRSNQLKVSVLVQIGDKGRQAPNSGGQKTHRVLRAAWTIT